MTMVNVPLLFLVFVGAVCGVYCLVGAGIWSGGRLWGRPAGQRIGYSLVVASGLLFLAYGAGVWL